MGPRVELIAGMLEVPRVSSLSPMASAGTEEWGHARARLPAEAEGGNPGEYSGESPEGVETRQEDPRMPKTTAITKYLDINSRMFCTRVFHWYCWGWLSKNMQKYVSRYLAMLG